MAESVKTFASTGATVPVGTNIAFDDVTVGGSTAVMEIIKIADGVSGSTTMWAMSSGSVLGGPGLPVNIVNSTSFPIGVALTGGQSSVTVSGAVPVTDNAGSLTVDFSTASKALVELTGGQSSVTVTSMPNLSTGSIIRVDTVAGTVTIAALSTASKILAELTGGQSSVTVTSLPALSTASKIQVELSTTLMGGSTGNPMFVSMQPIPVAVSTYYNGKLTSTTAVVALSSAASTRFVITGLDIVNEGATPTEFSIYDGSTAGTLLYRQWCSSAGGGISRPFTIPRYGTTGSSISIQINPASTVYVTFDAYRSS